MKRIQSSNYNWNRYYSPGVGRYLTADPLGQAGGINIYGYVLNDPVNFIDPLGLSATAAIAPMAGYISLMDGPLPFGEIIGSALLTGAALYDLYGFLDGLPAPALLDEEYGGYREGIPPLPEGATECPGKGDNAPLPKNSSDDFLDYLKSIGASAKKSERWRYIMKKYKTSDGKYIKHHYWRNRHGRTFYHLRKGGKPY